MYLSDPRTRKDRNAAGKTTLSKKTKKGQGRQLSTVCYIYWNTRWAFSSELMDMEEGLEGTLVVEGQTPKASGMKAQTLEQRVMVAWGSRHRVLGVCAYVCECVCVGAYMCMSVLVWVHACVSMPVGIHTCV